MAEPSLTVGLLLGTHLTVTGLFHERNLLFFIGNEHQHTGSEIAAGKGVLSKEGQRFQVRHIGVEQYVRDASVCQFLREASRLFECGRHDDDTIELLRQELTHHAGEGGIVETLVVYVSQCDAEVTTEVGTGLSTFLYLVPVGLLLVLGQHDVKGVFFIVGEGRGIDVGLVVHLLQSLVHFVEGCFRHVRTIVQNTVHRSH